MIHSIGPPALQRAPHSISRTKSEPPVDLTRSQSGHPPGIHVHCFRLEYWNPGARRGRVIYKPTLNEFPVVPCAIPEKTAQPFRCPTIREIAACDHRMNDI